MEKNEMQSVPFVVYEAAEVRSERIIKRLIILCVIVTALLFVTNVLWLNAWTSYDYIEETGDEITVDSDDGGNANYVGNNGDINNG